MCHDSNHSHNVFRGELMVACPERNCPYRTLGLDLAQVFEHVVVQHQGDKQALSTFIRRLMEAYQCDMGWAA